LDVDVRASGTSIYLFTNINTAYKVQLTIPITVLCSFAVQIKSTMTSNEFGHDHWNDTDTSNTLRWIISNSWIK